MIYLVKMCKITASFIVVIILHFLRGFLMRVISQIGRGGFGNVDLVVDKKGNNYAKKTFSVNQPGDFPPAMIANVKKRFVREANMQSEISHRNIVPVIEKLLNEEPPCFIMPLAVSTLDKDIAENKNLDGKYKTAIMDILAGLEEIHSMDIYHRDLKPQNVLKLGTDDEERYAISDFGLMSINDTQLSVITHTGMRMGSDCYTAPEIVADLRKASARSDIYSVGCILHDFVGTSDRIPCNEVTDDASPYADIIRCCTRKDPNRRFPTVSALRDAIISIDSEISVPATQKVADFIEVLASEDEIDINDWQLITSYLEDNEIDADSIMLLQRLSIDRIIELTELDNNIAARLGTVYAEWAKNGTFDFSSCDGIANRLCEFYNTENISVQSEVLLALLFMGTSHNRWYVENKFMSKSGSDMSPLLAKRLAMEIRIIGRDACRAISHLERSINARISSLNPILQETIKKVCA